MKKKTTIIAMLTSLLIASCTHQVDITTTTTDATPLRIGQIGIAHTAATRIDIDAEAFAVNDQILVTANCFPADADATATTPSQPVSTIYSLTDAGWKPDAPDAAPIIAQHIDPATPITIHSWGGHATWSGSIDYTNQRTAQAYRLNDLLLCPAATLTAATLSGTLAHSRVDVVLRLTDAYPHQPLPTAATFTLGGATGKHIHTWRQGKSDLVTTFRACIDPADVPATLLGTLTFRAHGQDYTARINYTLTPPATQVEAGMRILIDATYTQPDAPEDPTPPAPTEYEVKATATVTAWNNIDGGDAGTTDLPTGTIIATGEEPLDVTEFTAANPVWMITGGAEASEQADVLKNVKKALTDVLINNTNDRIHVMLTGFAGDITTQAFENCGALETISLPAATAIGGGAFQTCVNLTTASLPVATTIGNSAFNGCAKLTTLSLPAAKIIEFQAFRNCGALATISLPAATSIGTSAFYSCDKLTTISLPAAKTIGSYAFGNCDALATVSLPAATSLGENVFAGCALTTLELTGTEPIKVNNDAFAGIDNSNNNDGAKNVTLVLNKDIEKIGVSIATDVNGKRKVTFSHTSLGPDSPSALPLTVTFAAVVDTDGTKIEDTPIIN